MPGSFESEWFTGYVPDLQYFARRVRQEGNYSPWLSQDNYANWDMTQSSNISEGHSSPDSLLKETTFVLSIKPILRDKVKGI